MQSAGQPAVGLAGTGVAGRVVVEENNRVGTTGDCCGEYFSRVGSAFIEASDGDPIPSDRLQFRVDEDRDKIFFILLMVGLQTDDAMPKICNGSRAIQRSLSDRVFGEKGFADPQKFDS